MEYVEATFAVLDSIVRVCCTVMGFLLAIAALHDGTPYDRRAYLMSAAAFLMVLANA